MNAAPPQFDLAAARRAFARAAPHYDQAAVLQREVAQRMAERLTYVKLKPSRILDLGCGTGADLNLLGERYPQASRIGCDFAAPMLHEAARRGVWFKRLLPMLTGSRPQFTAADAVRLPLKTASVSLIWSNLMLHWVNDPAAAIKEMRRVLEVDGLLMFTTLGTDTLRELRTAFSSADAAPHVHRFLDMHDIGDMLVAAGFAVPVMDMETITLTYDSLDALLRDLKQSGAHNALAERNRGLMGTRAWHRVITGYEAMRRDGRLPATFEIVYGHAWNPAPRMTEDGRAIVRFDRSRG